MILPSIFKYLFLKKIKNDTKKEKKIKYLLAVLIVIKLFTNFKVAGGLNCQKNKIGSKT